MILNIEILADFLLQPESLRQFSEFVTSTVEARNKHKFVL